MRIFSRALRWLVPASALMLLAACERPPIDASQTGFRGTGMAQVYNPRTLQEAAPLNAAPPIAPAIAPRPGAPTAGQVYQNVKVLGDLNLGEFGRTMNAITEWVSPQQGCAYCHIEGNFADDSKYTKVVARRMLQMTKHINTDWKTHVADTGVTCYTCHRGNNVPREIWFKPEPGKFANGSLGDNTGQNRPAMSVAMSSLPYDPFTPYLLEAQQIRVNSEEAAARFGDKANRSSVKQAEHTYGLMMHMSTSLGVNCTYCHNTRSFATWEGESTPKRATAWYGIRMARSLNVDYLDPLGPTYPPYRLGPVGDSPKLNCATCHQGAYKPLYGAAMAAQYPALIASANVDAVTPAVIDGAPDAAATPEAAASAAK